MRFYGKANAEARGVTEFYARSHNSEAAKDDPFALHMSESAQLTALYLDAEHEDGYYRDKSVFDDGINIEDVMGVGALQKQSDHDLLAQCLSALARAERGVQRQ